jgi:hypothetical protein
LAPANRPAQRGRAHEEHTPVRLADEDVQAPRQRQGHLARLPVAEQLRRQREGFVAAVVRAVAPAPRLLAALAVLTVISLLRSPLVLLSRRPLSPLESYECRRLDIETG